MKRQFVVTHTIRQTEIPALSHFGVHTAPHFKMLCPQKHRFSLHFRKTITCLIDGVLRLGQAISVSYEIVYRYVTMYGLNREQ